MSLTPQEKCKFKNIPHLLCLTYRFYPNIHNEASTKVIKPPEA